MATALPDFTSFEVNADPNVGTRFKKWIPPSTLTRKLIQSLKSTNFASVFKIEVNPWILITHDLHYYLRTEASQTRIKK